ncbi:pituitary homeobox homolog Ptx1-like, partial [Nilaparvata lugens]|uniref:pituitary homeobox homolog Ptx1-like n=1 Tax=Nilaparvata lugens TaxID=108931 RepID=UPI00193E23FE
MEGLADNGLCLQDLVSSSASDSHSLHNLHDAVAPGGLGGAMLGHHHHVHHHDTSHHHPVPCAPTVLHHEPLEKLKRVWAESSDFRDNSHHSVSVDYTQIGFTSSRSKNRDRKGVGGGGGGGGG